VLFEKKLDHPSVIAAISQCQWRLLSGLTVDILSIFCDGFMVRCANLMLSKFIYYFVVLFDPFCLSLKGHLSETFYQVGYEHYTGEIWKTW